MVGSGAMKARRLHTLSSPGSALTSLGALGLGLGLAACGGPSDCGDDPAKCAAVLNENADACAEAFTYKTGNSKRKYCENAVEVAGEKKVAEAVPGLVKIVAKAESGVPDDDHRAQAANALGKIGSKDAVDALVEAIDLEVGTSDDPKDKMGNRANEEIAEALGKIGDPKAATKLLALMDRSRDNNVKLWSMRALGMLKAEEAVEPLIEVALKHENKFMRKNAVIALGSIGNPKAIDALIEMMFVEFQGVSFYREASYALFEIGPEAVEPLLKTLAMENEAVNAIFEKSGGAKESAVVAKCAVVLGDLHDARAVEPLIEAYGKALEKNDAIAIRELAFALGALDDNRAVPALMKNMSTPDASLRERVMESLNKIGDRRPVKDMIASMTVKDFIKRCVKLGASKSACEGDQLSRAAATKAAADQATFLVGAEEVEAFEKVVDAEPLEELKKYLQERLAAAKLAAECKQDVSCWKKYASHDNELFRQKAYWELGRIQNDEAQKVLAEGLEDKKRKARAAAIYSYWKFGDASVVPAIEAQLEREKGAADFMVVNEDLKRMLLDLKRKG